jgi:hypothetical protein
VVVRTGGEVHLLCGEGGGDLRFGQHVGKGQPFALQERILHQAKALGQIRPALIR